MSTQKSRPLAKAPDFNRPRASNRPAIIFVIGPPGSGKSTLCSRICEEYPESFRHLSVGDYLRDRFSVNASESVSSPASFPASEPGCLPPDEIAKYVQESRLLPPSTIIPLIEEKLLAERYSSSAVWLIDGFPRDIETAVPFDREFGVPLFMIRVTCDDSIARERFLKRRRASSDNEERFERRLEEYNENLEQLLLHYGDKPSCRMHVNSGEDDWVNKALGSFEEQCKGFVHFASPREGK